MLDVRDEVGEYRGYRKVHFLIFQFFKVKMVCSTVCYPALSYSSSGLAVKATVHLVPDLKNW